MVTFEQCIIFTFHWIYSTRLSEPSPPVCGKFYLMCIYFQGMLWIMISLLTCQFFVDGRKHYIGNKIANRKHVDTARMWTFVYQDTFKFNGLVDRIDMHAKKNNRGLKVGIYRSQSKQKCDYKLVQQVTLKKIRKGVNKVLFSLRIGNAHVYVHEITSCKSYIYQLISNLIYG